MSGSFSQRARRPSVDNKPLPIPAEPARITRKELPPRRNTQEEDIKILIQNCDELHQKWVETDNELQRAVKALGSVHSSDTFFLDDNQITNLVKTLRYDIKQWSHQNFPRGTPLKKSLVASYLYPPGNPFSSIATNPKYYLSPDHGGELPDLIQSYIWSRLVKRVFDNGMWVAGTACLNRNSGTEKRPCKLFDYWYGLDRLLLEGEKQNPELYNQWKALTARLVPPQAHPACVNEGIRRLVKEIRNELKILPPAENKHIFYEPEADRSTDHDLTMETIIISAVSLDRVLWQQKASFSFGSLYERTPPKKFNPEIMDFGLDDEAPGVSGGIGNTTSLSGSYSVQLVIAPYLYKDGSQEGNGYGAGEVLLKAVVDLNQPTSHLEAGPPSSALAPRTGSVAIGGSQSRAAGAFSPL